MSQKRYTNSPLYSHSLSGEIRLEGIHGSPLRLDGGLQCFASGVLGHAATTLRGRGEVLPEDGMVQVATACSVS
jgi:hypothetical protein